MSKADSLLKIAQHYELDSVNTGLVDDDYFIGMVHLRHKFVNPMIRSGKLKALFYFQTLHKEIIDDPAVFDSHQKEPIEDQRWMVNALANQLTAMTRFKTPHLPK